MAKATKMVTHDFGCMNCGKTLPIARRMSKIKEQGHRKKLFCPYCKNTVNMVEFINYNDRIQFFEDFNNGLYVEEAKSSMEYCKYE